MNNQTVLTNVVCQDDGMWDPNPHAFSSFCGINDSGESASVQCMYILHMQYCKI